MNLQHWKTETDQDQIVWWHLDRKDAAANSLNREVFEELEFLIDDIKKNIENNNINFEIKGIIIHSSKSNGFVAGADIKQFLQIKSEEQAYMLVQQGQRAFNKLETLKIPTLAIISGFCMGGGTELALACKYRIAEDDPKTRIGFPEVKLGLQPGWGGTIRLPLLIGVLKAMKMILTGDPVDAVTAAKLGVVDAAVPNRHLIHAAKAFILDNPPKRQLKYTDKIYNKSLLRPIIAKFLRLNLRKKINKQHYPAPYTIIDLWEKDGCTSPDASQNEARSLAHLIVSETSKNLVRVFFLQEQLKSLAKNKNLNYKIQHVHVVGAGTMGGDIAALCALRGLKVTLQDRESKFIAPAIKRAYDLFKYRLKSSRLIQAAMDRIIPDIEGNGISQADIIIEAIIEDSESKQNLFNSLESKAKPEAILATNTSSIILDKIKQKMKNPERLIGVHFFNPASKMPLVEIVHTEKTDQNILFNAMGFIRSLDKLPLPVKSAPGFLVNRILMPYLGEAMTLLQEGLSPEAIDDAAVQFGMPMGPIELMDTIGLDICLSVAKHLAMKSENLDLLEKMVKEKKLGRKTNLGFYQYKNGKAQKHKINHIMINQTSIADKLISSMITEANTCLQEKIVENIDLLDAGMIFGIGFPPFRGGLLHYANTLISPPSHQKPCDQTYDGQD